MPERIQRKRTRGWRMPEGAVYVGRPTKWGNPFKIGDEFKNPFGIDERDCYLTVTRENCIPLFETYAKGRLASEPDWLEPLRGKDPACWCPLMDKNGNPVPCHADILLRLANS